jgi:hypothetical protein
VDLGGGSDEAFISEWSNPWTWGGNYGGGDDGTFRLVMGPGKGCGEDKRDAFFTLDAGGSYAAQVAVRHLDGSQNDSYDIFIKEGSNWNSIGSYEGVGGSEFWVTSYFDFTPRQGIVEFKITATGPISGWCDNWGQLAVSWVQLGGYQ